MSAETKSGDDPRYSERDLVMAKREAWVAARKVGPCQKAMSVTHVDCLYCQDEAKARYPLPKVERPRVQTDSDSTSWRVVDGRVQWARRNGQFNNLASDYKTSGQMYVSIERAQIIVDLLARPTELAEDHET